MFLNLLAFHSFLIPRPLVNKCVDEYGKQDMAYLAVCYCGVRPPEMRERGEPGDARDVCHIASMVEDVDVQTHTPNALLSNDAQGLHVQATRLLGWVQVWSQN